MLRSFDTNSKISSFLGATAGGLVVAPLPPINEDDDVLLMKLNQSSSMSPAASTISSSGSIMRDNQIFYYTSCTTKRKEESSLLVVCPPPPAPNSTSKATKKSCFKQSRLVLQSKRQVVFGDISIRRYDVTLGDNPSVTKGVPLSLDWTFVQQPTIALDDYEDMKAVTTAAGRQRRWSCSSSRTNQTLFLNSHQRKTILLEAGFDRDTLRHAKKEIHAAHLQRKLSYILSPIQLIWYQLRQ